MSITVLDSPHVQMLAQQQPESSGAQSLPSLAPCLRSALYPKKYTACRAEFLLQHRCLSRHIPVLLHSEDHTLPEGRERGGCFPSLFSLLALSGSLCPCGRTLTRRGRHVGRARVMLLCGPQMKSLCSETCFVGLSFRKSNCHAVCRQLFLPLRAPQPAGDQAHGGALHGLSQ